MLSKLHPACRSGNCRGSARGCERRLKERRPCLTPSWTVADARPVSLSKTQVVLYTILAVGIIAGLAYGLPRWQLVILGLIVGIADVFTSRRDPSPQTIDAKRAPIKGKIRRSPGVEDWALLAVSIGFCVIGLLLVRYDWRTAVVTIAMFGAGALTFLSIIRRKRREQQWKGATVRVSGGVNIYMDTPRMGLIALGLCIVGAVMYFVSSNYPLLFRLIGAFIGLVGVGLAIFIALGFHGRNFLRFDPDAITIREGRIRYRIAWDNCARVVEIEYASNPVVGIELASVDAVVVKPAMRGDLFLRLVHRNRGFMGVDILIYAGQFGIDGTVLAAALAGSLRPATDRALAIGAGGVHGADVILRAHRSMRSLQLPFLLGIT